MHAFDVYMYNKCQFKLVYCLISFFLYFFLSFELAKIQNSIRVNINKKMPTSNRYFDWFIRGNKSRDTMIGVLQRRTSAVSTTRTMSVTILIWTIIFGFLTWKSFHPPYLLSYWLKFGIKEAVLFMMRICKKKSIITTRLVTPKKK